MHQQAFPGPTAIHGHRTIWHGGYTAAFGCVILRKPRTLPSIAPVQRLLELSGSPFKASSLGASGRPRPLSWSRPRKVFATRPSRFGVQRAHSVPGRPMARQRRPKAVQVGGGRWMRPPRPRPPENEAQHSEQQHGDLGYESCEVGDS